MSVTRDSPVSFEEDDEEEEGGLKPRLVASFILIVPRDTAVRVGPIYRQSLDMGRRKGRQWERAERRGKEHGKTGKA